jgi:predicted NUDIX family NTP pyrophosphohydrolase
LLLYRPHTDTIEVFLVHPGGPYWAGKDEHAWSVPKGLCEAGEDPLAAAEREFLEETGIRITGAYEALPAVRLAGGKVLYVWALNADCDPQAIRSNQFTMEWPPRSGRTCSFPEVDRAAWFPLEQARAKIHKGQVPLLDELGRRFAAGNLGR